jgi:hypothetical protein
VEAEKGSDGEQPAKLCKGVQGIHFF